MTITEELALVRLQRLLSSGTAMADAVALIRDEFGLSQHSASQVAKAVSREPLKVVSGTTART